MNANITFHIPAVSLTVETVFTSITSALHRSSEGVLEAAKCLVQFEGYKEFGELRKRLAAEKIMAKSTISQYLTIGKCTVLSRVVDKLPPSFNSIYHLAKMEKKTKGYIEDQIAKGKLNRATKLEDIRASTGISQSDWIQIMVEVNSHISPSERKSLKEEIINLIQVKGHKVKPASTKKSSAPKGGK